MKLSKFPVTSKNGIEYLVEIKERVWDQYEVSVYLRKTGLFGIKYHKLVNPTIIGSGGNWLTGSKYNYDFVEMAKSEIESFENEVQANIDRENLVSANAAKFNEWDGDC